MNLEEIKKQPVKHIFMYSIPAIVAMILSSFVTIVDGLFISRVLGKKALGAVNLGIPILYVFLAVGVMIGVGGVSLSGRRLGAKEIDKSINLFNQTLITGAVCLSILSFLFFIGLKPFLGYVGLDLETQSIMLSYYEIMLWVYPFMMLNVIFGMFIRCEGKPHWFMINTIITTCINILMDYIFIVRFNFGVKGAAYASAIGVIVGTLFMVMSFLSSKTLFSFKSFKFQHTDFKETLTNGSSEFIGQISSSITMLFLNGVILNKLGVLGVAAMTLIGYTGYIFNMIVIGFGQGVSPMISYSYGAKSFSLSVLLRQYTTKIVVLIGVIFFTLLSVGASTYAHVFAKEPELVNLVVKGLKLFSMSFILMGFNVIVAFYFTAVGRAKESAIISSLRGLVILSINIFLLPILLGVLGIWLIAPVTEVLTCFVGIYFLQKVKNVEFE